MLKIVKDLFQEWNNTNIIYCHWKSNEHLEEGLNGETDLDILVSTNDIEKCEKSLVNNDYVKFNSQYGSRYKMVEEWLGYDSETGKLIHIHLHYRIITGHRGLKEYIFGCDELVLKTRTLDEKTGIYITNPNLEIIILYSRISLKLSIVKKLKILMKKYRISKDDRKEIEWLKNQIDLEELKKYTKMIYSKNNEKIYNIIIKNKIVNKDLLQLNKLCRKELNKNCEDNIFALWFKKNYYSFVLKCRDKLKKKYNTTYITKKIKNQNKGLLITFIGQDGSGKSTTSDIIYKWLNWKVECKYFYLGCGDNYNSIKKNLNKKLKGKKNPIIKIIKAYLVLSDYALLAKNTYKALVKAKKYSNKGGIAIFDRYPQVEFYGINDGPKIRDYYLNKANNSIIKIIVKKYAKKEEKYLEKASQIYPNIVFKLIISPEESIKRKPEENIEIIKKKYEIIKKISFNNSTVIMIDAEQDYDEEIKEIKENIWKEIQKL